MKNLYFFGGSFFKTKTADILIFFKNQIFGQRFIIFPKLRYKGQLLKGSIIVEIKERRSCYFISFNIV